MPNYYRDNQGDYDNVFQFEDQSPQTNIYIHNEFRAPKGIIEHLNGCAVVVIILCMLFWSASIIMLSVPFGVTAIIGAVIAQIALWAVIWFFYWLGYKFYWIMLAFSWLMLTLLALFFASGFAEFAMRSGFVVR